MFCSSALYLSLIFKGLAAVAPLGDVQASLAPTPTAWSVGSRTYLGLSLSFHSFLPNAVAKILTGLVYHLQVEDVVGSIVHNHLKNAISDGCT